MELAVWQQERALMNFLAGQRPASVELSQLPVHFDIATRIEERRRDLKESDDTRSMAEQMLRRGIARMDQLLNVGPVRFLSACLWSFVGQLHLCPVYVNQLFLHKQLLEIS